jgi:hypothetical protein
LPDNMIIANLRDRLVGLIQEFRRTVSLQEGCNAALQSDCLKLADRLYVELTRALRRVHLLRAGDRWMLNDLSSSSSSKPDAAETREVFIIENEESLETHGRKGVWVQPPRTSILQKKDEFTQPASVHASPSKYPSPRA